MLSFRLGVELLSLLTCEFGLLSPFLLMSVYMYACNSGPPQKALRKVEANSPAYIKLRSKNTASETNSRRMLVIAALVFLLSSLSPPCTPQETLPHAPPLPVGQLKVSSYNTARKLRLGDRRVERECGAEDWQCPSRSEAAESADQELTRPTEATAVPIARNDLNEEKGGEFFSMDYHSPATHLPINN